MSRAPVPRFIFSFVERLFAEGAMLSRKTLARESQLVVTVEAAAMTMLNDIRRRARCMRAHFLGFFVTNICASRCHDPIFCQREEARLPN